MQDLETFLDRCLDWLSNSPIRRDDGAVLSWVNKKKPGYVYPEIIGYTIKFFAHLHMLEGKESHLALAKRSADYLSEHLTAAGAAGRDGYDYVFDSAICVSGLIGLSKVEALNEAHAQALKRLADFVFTSLSNKHAVFKDGEPVVDNDRWSLSMGSLLLKNVMALHELSEYFGDDTYKKLADEIFAHCKDAFRENHFSINAEREWVYTHPHCYATEGLLYLSTQGYPVDDMIEKAATWLARNQNANGSMNNWYLHQAPIEQQGDATAQAARIWICVNKERFEENIKNAFSFLRSLQSSEGGLVYNINTEGEKSKDVNSWVTLFAAQAAHFYINAPHKEWIV